MPLGSWYAHRIAAQKQILCDASVTGPLIAEEELLNFLHNSCYFCYTSDRYGRAFASPSVLPMICVHAKMSLYV